MNHYQDHIAKFANIEGCLPYDSITQSYNRYAYVMNNPMKFTDPSGFVSVGHMASNFSMVS